MRIWLAVLVLALAGCTGKPSVTSPDPGVLARNRLSLLAAKAAGNSFDATYRFTERATAATGTIRIRQVPPQYRLDISTTTTASFFALRTGFVSCTRRKNRTDYSCFLVARPGEPVPDLFDPGVQRLFRDAVTGLAEYPRDYAVQALSPSPSPSASPGVPAGECFHVERTSTPSPRADGQVPAGFETGDYCFAEEGYPTRYDVATGTLVLVAVGPAPDPTAFQPPAKPATLPDLTPSPTPTPR